MSAIRRVVNQPWVRHDDLEAWLWQDLSARARETLRLGYEPCARDREVRLCPVLSGRLGDPPAVMLSNKAFLANG